MRIEVEVARQGKARRALVRRIGQRLTCQFGGERGEKERRIRGEVARQWRSVDPRGKGRKERKQKKRKVEKEKRRNQQRRTRKRGKKQTEKGNKPLPMMSMDTGQVSILSLLLWSRLVEKKIKSRAEQSRGRAEREQR